MVKPRLRAAGEDHPRLRGEKPLIYARMFFFAGSPPLTRGKADILADLLKLPGITPAYAGKSIPGIVGKVDMKDHPRLRGEKG